MKNALISVYYKDGLDKIVKKLNELNINIYSTGGTYDFIEKQGVEVNSVEDLTGYPSILGGRVKTLHPKVFGGILSRRELESDNTQLKEYDIPEFDLVIVDLYPFEDTVKSDSTEQEIIEKIDIGGISLIRAAAKNFKDVLVVSSRNQYDDLFNLLTEKNGETNIDDRKRFASHAFNISSHYDTAIFNYFNDGNLNVLKQSLIDGRTLRYGENPHQKGTYFGNLDEVLEQLHGKEISYNNLLDIDAAINLISEFDETTFVVLKHNNACGLASRPVLLDAWKDALAGDPVSAFGGVLIANKEIDIETAEEMNKLFFEVVIAPSYNSDALAILKQKKNRIILIQKDTVKTDKIFKSLLNGVIVQDKDVKTDHIADMRTATIKEPTSSELTDLEFANKIVKHTKSNAIVLAKNKQLISSGVGQTSRVDALVQAIQKAKNFNLDMNNSVMASDAFFPFPDCIEIADAEKITAVIQPGGSIKDKDSISYCNNHNMSMVFTGTRHFKH